MTNRPHLPTAPPHEQALGITFNGAALIHLWLFAGGFFGLGAAFYVVAPRFINTATCCGPGTEQTHLLISVLLGLLGGALALWVLRIGVFLTGTCLGLALSLSLRSVLATTGLFSSSESFVAVYVAAALVGGGVALWKEEPVIICATSVCGAFAFFVGVGHLSGCQFIALLDHVEQDLLESRDPAAPVALDHCVLLLGALFAALAGLLSPCHANTRKYV